MALDMTTALTIRAKVDGQQQLNSLSKSLDGVSRASNGSATALGRLKTASAGALGALRTFLPVLGVAAFGRFVKSNLDSADAISKLSQRTGIAAPTLDKFRKVAELSDTSIDALGKGFNILASNISDAALKGSGPAAEAFQKLGISLTDASGKILGTDEVFLQIADRFRDLEDGTEKAALASDIFGQRLGSELIPLLNSGGDAVRNIGTSLTQDFADKAADFNDKIEGVTERLQDVALSITKSLLPALEAAANVIEPIAKAFAELPQPIQNLIVSIGLLATAWGLLAPVITPLIGLLKSILALKIGAIIAGWAGAIAPLVGALKGLGAILAGVFTGPVGWIALAVAAGVAIFTFRDNIAKAFQAIGQIIKAAAKLYYDVFIKPVVTGAKIAVDGIKKGFSLLKGAITAPFESAFKFVKSALNGFLAFIVKGINAAIAKINSLIKAYNSIPVLPDAPTVGTVSAPAFAAGGVVSGPTLAMVGEGGEPEYIVPESKMARAAANYLSGMRGRSVIPAFAEGGVVGPMGGGGAGNTTVQITTGPVLQQDGQRYVTVGDLERALQDFGSQVFRNSRSYGGRRYQGAY